MDRSPTVPAQRRLCSKVSNISDKKERKARDERIVFTGLDSEGLSASVRASMENVHRPSTAVLL